ncbi:MAG: cyclic nucleotide-binding domain-containing protein [Thermoanaerobaculales bacterium]|nr:cyclic nucleotide-binding domain-containing protein [Thermoanaerobaculales bacterium]
MAKFRTTGNKETHDSLEPMRTNFGAGEVIFDEGDLGLTMYVIERGEVEIRKKFGKEVRALAVLGKGDFFGEMCMLEEDVPRSATALALSDVEAVMIDRSAFTFILKHNPEITIRIMRKLIRRLRQTTEMLEEALGHAVDLDASDAGAQPGTVPDPRARLVEVSSGLVFPLAKGGETTVGRIDPVTGIHPDIDLTPVDTKRSISRRHARIRREEDGTFSVVEDVGTMNGTFVKGVRLTAGKPHAVEAGDTVIFGTIQCRFELDPTKG